MTPPKETSTGPKQDETLSRPRESADRSDQGMNTEVHKEGQDHLKDNVEFIRKFEQISTAEREKLWERARQWEKDSNIPALRAAGLSIDQIKKECPLERHIILAAMVLKRNPGTSELAFKCDFNGNNFAETELDVSDVMPANVLSVDILDENGKLIFENAKRGFKQGSPGYFTEPEGKRAFLRNGFTLKVEETQSAIALTHQQEGKQAYENAQKEEIYISENSLKESIGDKVREEAAKQGKDVYTDKRFTDTNLTGAVREAAAQGLVKDGKIDFSGLGDLIKQLVAQFGVIFSDLTKQISSAFDKKEDEKIANPQPEQTGSNPQTPQEDRIPKQSDLPGPEQRENLPTDSRDRRVVETARMYIGSTEFRWPDVAGGSLACVKVASTILHKAGVEIPVVLGVDMTKRLLLREQWEMYKGPPQAGDVIIWGKTPTRIVNGIAKPGHGHIGIMTGSEFAVHNKWNAKMPIEEKATLNSPRGVTFLRPPHRSSNKIA